MELDFVPERIHFLERVVGGPLIDADTIRRNHQPGPIRSGLAMREDDAGGVRRDRESIDVLSWRSAGCAPRQMHEVQSDRLRLSRLLAAALAVERKADDRVDA